MSEVRSAEHVESAAAKLRRGLAYDPGTYRGQPEQRRISELTPDEAAALLAELERLRAVADQFKNLRHNMYERGFDPEDFA